MPRRRKISMERAEIELHLTLGGSPARRTSATVTSTPRQAKSMASVRPTGPAPTISTSASSMGFIALLAASTLSTAPDDPGHRAIWTRQTDAASLGLDARLADHPSPFLGFFGNERPELGGRKAKLRAAQVRKLRPYPRIGEGCIDLFIEFLDDFGGRALGDADPLPNACLEARDETAQGRDIGQCRRTRRRRHGQC